MSDVKNFSSFVNEANNPYFDTFSAAVQSAKAEAEAKGFGIDEGDWWREISTGEGKPKGGQTFKATIGLSKNGKPQRKTLHIQVYDRGTNRNTYELNSYIN